MGGHLAAHDFPVVAGKNDFRLLLKGGAQRAEVCKDYRPLLFSVLAGDGEITIGFSELCHQITNPRQAYAVHPLSKVGFQCCFAAASLLYGNHTWAARVILHCCGTPMVVYSPVRWYPECPCR